MPIATVVQVRDLIQAARDGGYAYPAINVSSSETLNAAVRGFIEAKSDGIVQISTGGGTFLSGVAGDMAVGARALADYARVVVADVPLLIWLNTDHCPPDKLDGFLRPLLAESCRRVEAGDEPLFQSHMFDGSSLPLDENLRMAEGLLAEVAAIDVVLEVECGVVGGEEDGVSNADAPREMLYTTPRDLLRVAKRLGIGERGRYLLAATFGNVHGVYKPGGVALRPGVLRAGQDALASAYGAEAHFDYVFHGGSGSTAEEIAEAVSHGVVKMNLDTDLQYAYTSAVADHMLSRYRGVLKVDGDVGNKKDYDPRVWGAAAETSMAARVAEACAVLGSAGRSLLRGPQVTE